MRAIKFRVFDKTTEEMYFPGEDGTQLVIGMSHALNEDKNYMALWCDEGEIGREGDMVFSQFTGLYDKDGVGIYEGDIIQFFPCKERSEVKYEEGSYVYYKSVRVSFHSEERVLRQDSLVNLLTDHEYGNHCEIIGNIYANPELMEVPE